MADYKKIKDVTLKHGKKVGGIALKAAVATASAFGPAKKIKLVGKGIKLGKKGYKVIAKSGTVKGITKDIKKSGKAVKSGAYWVPFGIGFGLGKAYKGVKAVSTGVKKLKNVWTQPKKIKEIKKGKFNKSQFSTDDKDWGNPIIKNLLYKSKKSVKAIDKKLSKKSGYLATHKISKANYVKGLKERKGLAAYRKYLIDTKQY